ncbi:phage portal protein [Methylocucumis oryzae]|uniref:phage portal protein n=1 Tax=Methylocucumis oryzae TaxID=1632867 RepID=UPI00069843BE|nr:phage portal protein [Methylocucumis oryzae]
MRQIGTELGLPFEVLIKHYTSSYSAARAALLDAWRMFSVRRELVACYFAQPIYEEWLADQIANGHIIARGFFEDKMLRRAWSQANWIGDGPGSINPSVEADAAQKRIDMGISTIAAESILYDGIDWWTKHKQRTNEKSQRLKAGLEVPGTEVNGEVGQANA